MKEGDVTWNPWKSKEKETKIKYINFQIRDFGREVEPCDLNHKITPDRDFRRYVSVTPLKKLFF